jgi:hypothetical protein
MIGIIGGRHPKIQLGPDPLEKTSFLFKKRLNQISFEFKLY